MAKKLYVGNLSYGTSEDGLRTAFGQFGEVASLKDAQGAEVKNVYDKATGRLEKKVWPNRSEITYKYNENGRMEVEACDKQTGKNARTEIEHSGGLSRGKIEQQKKEFHEMEIG